MFIFCLRRFEEDDYKDDEVDELEMLRMTNYI